LPFIADNTTNAGSQVTGLRDRKKARRRLEILQCAAQLFARDGVDATTMTAIAVEADVSPPTVFNYFKSKENILYALIFEGSARERDQLSQHERKTNCQFNKVLGDFFTNLSRNTLQIASKRVWRYAEATFIRRPSSEFGKQFNYTDNELRKLISLFLDNYDIKLRNGQDSDLEFLSRLFFDLWNSHYMAFIKNDFMTDDAHEAELRQTANTLVSLLFDDEFAAHSPLKNPETF